MRTVAVVAHQDKRLNGAGLGELRQVLHDSGVVDPLWFEVPKSAKAPKQIRRAIKQGADLVFVWGGDGMVQHCIDAAAGSDLTVAILPAGTANLLAANLDIPTDLEGAVGIGLHGDARAIDVGVICGERFAVMAGAGFDARIMADVGGAAKKHFGRAAYFASSARAMTAGRRHMKVKVDGKVWFEGEASCVLFGNVGRLPGGLVVFPDAKPDDGMLEVGVITADGLSDWFRVLMRVVSRDPARSPMVNVTRGRKITVRMDEPLRYELDGGARTKTRKLRVDVEPSAVRVCVPKSESAGEAGVPTTAIEADICKPRR